jgi:hypothetical protein
VHEKGEGPQARIHTPPTPSMPPCRHPLAPCTQCNHETARPPAYASGAPMLRRRHALLCPPGPPAGPAAQATGCPKGDTGDRGGGSRAQNRAQQPPATLLQVLLLLRWGVPPLPAAHTHLRYRQGIYIQVAAAASKRAAAAARGPPPPRLLGGGYSWGHGMPTTAGLVLERVPAEAPFAAATATTYCWHRPHHKCLWSAPVARQRCSQAVARCTEHNMRRYVVPAACQQQQQQHYN